MNISIKDIDSIEYKQYSDKFENILKSISVTYMTGFLNENYKIEMKDLLIEAKSLIEKLEPYYDVTELKYILKQVIKNGIIDKNGMLVEMSVFNYSRTERETPKEELLNTISRSLSVIKRLDKRRYNIKARRIIKVIPEYVNFELDKRGKGK